MERATTDDRGWFAIPVPRENVRLPATPRFGVPCWWRRSGSRADMYREDLPAFLSAAALYRLRMTLGFWRWVQGCCPGGVRAGVQVVVEAAAVKNRALIQAEPVKIEAASDTEVRARPAVPMPAPIAAAVYPRSTLATDSNSPVE